MRTTTAHILPGQYIGDPSVIVTLTFDGIRQVGGCILATPGTDVAYSVTDGTHRITGGDMRASFGFRSTPDDLFRALCDFLINDAEHADYAERYGHGRGHRCPEYGAGCPLYRTEYIDNLAQLVGALESARRVGEDCEEYAA